MVQVTLSRRPGALDYASDDKVTERFEGLRQAEADHQRLLEVEMERLLA